MSMFDVDMKKMSDRFLLDYHRKTHMLYASAVNKTSLNRSYVNSIVDFHNVIVKEMMKRKMNHNTPLYQV